MTQAQLTPTTPVPVARRSNQRRCRRRTAKASTKARAYRNALGLGPNIAKGVLDVSENGARLLLRHELKPGQEFEINLESPGGRTVKLIAEVIWSVPAADGTFVVGSRFQKPLGYADLESLARG